MIKEIPTQEYAHISRMVDKEQGRPGGRTWLYFGTDLVLVRKPVKFSHALQVWVYFCRMFFIKIIVSRK